MFITPGRCAAVTGDVQVCDENHRERRRCITTVSFEEPLLIAATNSSLSYWNSM